MMIVAGTTLADDQWSTAKRAMDHDFTVCGYRYRFPGTIDWNHNPTYNGYAEWPWQFARHYFLPDLARYYTATGDERAARSFVEILESFIDNALPPPPDTPHGASKSWRTLDTGLRAGIWIDTYAAFTNSPAFTPQFREKFILSLSQHIARLQPCRTTNNWRIMELKGLALIILEFPELDPDGTILRQAEGELDGILSAQLYPDGFHFELAPGYHGILPNDFSSIADHYRHVGRTPPDFLERGIELSFELYTHIARPDFRYPDINDSECSSVTDMLERAARLYPRREDFRWFATERREGVAPAYLSYAFPYAGAVIFRNSWRHDAVWGYVDMSPFGRGHQHEDKLNFLLFAYGKEMLTEGGIYDYDTSEMRKYVRSTRSHNTIRIDGHDQYTRKTWQWQPEMLHERADLKFTTTPELDRAVASFTNGYHGVGDTLETAVTHTRTVEFVKNEGAPYFRIIDELSTPQPLHTYEQLWHLETCQLQMNDADFTADFGDGITLTATFESENGRLVDLIGQKTPEYQGWKPIRPYGDHEHRPIHTPTLRGTFRGKAKIVVTLRPKPAELHTGDLNPYRFVP